MLSRRGGAYDSLSITDRVNYEFAIEVNYTIRALVLLCTLIPLNAIKCFVVAIEPISRLNRIKPKLQLYKPTNLDSTTHVWPGNSDERCNFGNNTFGLYNDCSVSGNTVNSGDHGGFDVKGNELVGGNSFNVLDMETYLVYNSV